MSANGSNSQAVQVLEGLQASAGVVEGLAIVKTEF